MKKKYIIILASVLVIAIIVACGQIFTVRSVSVVFHNKTALADEAGVLAASGLSGHNNIFNIKEREIKSRVASAYPDRSVVVTNIVRNFPNEVVLYVKERIPIFKLKVYSAEGDDKYVPTDKDFQRGNVSDGGEINAVLIEVNGFEVHETFDVKECVQLRTVANALIKSGLAEESLAYFIESATFSDGALSFLLRETQARLTFLTDVTAEKTALLYARYIALDEQSRYGAELSE